MCYFVFQVLIPVQIVQSPSAGSSSSQSNAKPAEGSSASSDSTQASGSSQGDNKPRRTGSLALFFRKVFSSFVHQFVNVSKFV